MSMALAGFDVAIPLIGQVTVQTTQQPPTWAMFVPMLIALAIGFAISIVICLLLYKAQDAVPPEHRRIEPGMIWLLLIPIFNLVWNFWVFLRVPESYQSAFYSHGRTDVGDCGRQIGLCYAICSACSLIPCVGMFAGCSDGLVDPLPREDLWAETATGAYGHRRIPRRGASTDAPFADVASFRPAAATMATDQMKSPGRLPA